MGTEDNRFIGSAKVGPKGQIVIPKEVREMFGISPGDTLIVLADINRGIAIAKYSAFEHTADAIFAGKSKELYEGHTREEAVAFAEHIKHLGEGESNE